MRYEIKVGSCDELDELAALWQQMLAHHRRVVSGRFPVRDAETSWARVRGDYAQWLRDGDAFLLIAREARSLRPLGYAVYMLEEPGATFDFGGPRGEVHSLAVADDARGLGIGSSLLETIRADLLERGVEYWSIGVLADNTDAQRLYQRLGFQPWNQSLLSSTRSRPDIPR